MWKVIVRAWTTALQPARSTCSLLPELHDAAALVFGRFHCALPFVHQLEHKQVQQENDLIPWSPRLSLGFGVPQDESAAAVALSARGGRPLPVEASLQFSEGLLRLAPNLVSLQQRLGVERLLREAGDELASIRVNTREPGKASSGASAASSARSCASYTQSSEGLRSRAPGMTPLSPQTDTNAWYHSCPT